MDRTTKPAGNGVIGVCPVPNTFGSGKVVNLKMRPARTLGTGRRAQAGAATASPVPPVAERNRQVPAPITDAAQR